MGARKPATAFGKFLATETDPVLVSVTVVARANRGRHVLVVAEIGVLVVHEVVVVKPGASQTAGVFNGAGGLPMLDRARNSLPARASP